MNQLKFDRVLVLSPHTDDAEIACGGTMVRLIRNGAQLKSVAFSGCEESVPSEFPRDELRKEFFKAHMALGVNNKNCQVLDFKVRKFPEQRQEILEKLVALNREWRPDLVLVTSTYDTHQDHLTLAEEAYRAFKKTSIWAYDCPWNQQFPKLNCFIKLDEELMGKKLAAIAQYKSQQFRGGYVNEEFIRALALLRGGQIGEPLGEAFEIVRYMHW